MFKFKQNENGYWRFYDEELNEEFGTFFQKACRSDEWQAAGIVHEKYKRKFNLEHKDLIELTKYIVNWAQERDNLGKKINKDILVQECSSYMKKKFNGS